MHKNEDVFTLRSQAGAGVVPPALEESVVVVIDVQQEYDHGGLALPDFESAVEAVNELLVVARERGVPIVHVAHVGPAGGLFDPTAGGRLAVDVVPGEPIISKGLPNSFAATNLQETLVQLGVTNLVFAGFMTHMCISSTARAAVDLGYASTVLHDATATRSLPGIAGGPIVSADDLHAAALAALADRFSYVTSVRELTLSSPM